MSRCVACGKENHNGNDICNECEEEEYWERMRQEKIRTQEEMLEAEEYWEHMRELEQEQENA